MTGSLPTSAAERRLSGMRSRQLASFDRKCRIVRPTTQKTPAGGTRKVSETIAENVDCTLAFPSVDPRDVEDQARTTTSQRAEIRVPVGTPVSIACVVEVVGAGRFYVQGHDLGASYADSVTLQCVRADDGESQP